MYSLGRTKQAYQILDEALDRTPDLCSTPCRIVSRNRTGRRIQLARSERPPTPHELPPSPFTRANDGNHARTGSPWSWTKGLSLREAEDLISIAGDRVDFLKLGFGTSMFAPNLAEKVKLYRDAGMDVYCGGTLFEAFLVRNRLDDYLKFIDDAGGGLVSKSVMAPWSSTTITSVS